MNQKLVKQLLEQLQQETKPLHNQKTGRERARAPHPHKEKKPKLAFTQTIKTTTMPDERGVCDCFLRRQTSKLDLRQSEWA